MSGVNFNGLPLAGVDFSKMVFRGAQFDAAKIRGGNFEGADLNSAKFCDTDLSFAQLDGADLSGANLQRADMRGAHFSRSKLQGTFFIDVALSEADLSDAEFGNTVIVRTDLRGAKGLDRCFHSEPSTIDFSTVEKEPGIPDEFLHGLGLSEAVIAYKEILRQPAVEFYSCFISYSTHDQEFAERLYADLQAKGVRCWFAPHDIRGGRKIHEQIDEAIRTYDKLLLILSEHSMSSNWVKTEIANTRERQKIEEKRVLFPVRLVSYEAIRRWEYIDSSGRDLAEEIRQYFIPDFSNWKDHDSYQAALQKLVADLKAAWNT